MSWIKLLNEKPAKGIYRVLRYSDYKEILDDEYLLWVDGEGFQPLDYFTNREAHPINMNVTHWLKVESENLPIAEAEKLVVETEVFFHHPRLDEFAAINNVEEYGRYGNATEYIISNVVEDILRNMRILFQSNGTHKNVRK